MATSAPTAQASTDAVDCSFVGELSQVPIGLRVGAIFIVLTVSTLGSLLPLLARHGCALPPIILKLGQAFGTGVILATAFIHMLPPAFAALTNPCLPSFYTDTYTSFSGLIALLAVLLVQGVEYTCTIVAENRFGRGAKQQGNPPASATHSNGGESEGSEVVAAIKDDEEHGHSHGIVAGANGSNVSTLSGKVTVLILEVGISFHSVIIGFLLGVLVDSEFNTLLVAICFHQFFEGIALGATVLDANFKRWVTFMTVCMYGLTTPLGVLIGILATTTYNPNSVRGLITQGVFDSISGGILIYSSLVTLLSQHYTRRAAFRKEPPKVQAATYCAIYLGVTAMAIIGAYA